jgi:glyoxylase-like metal-dependent hydrolase (beta-lactamase superfamily II)
MLDRVPYPEPPRGPWREIHARLTEGRLLPGAADRLLGQSLPWQLVAAHVVDLEWWKRQPLAVAPPPKTPLSVSAWGATLRLQAPAVDIWIDPGPVSPIPDRAPDLILVSHAHQDHTARLYELCERFDQTPVVMTPQTAALLMLRSVQTSGAHRHLRRCLIQLPFNVQRMVAGIGLQLFPAGHVLGAAQIELDLAGDSLLITGDFALREVGGLAGGQWSGRPYTWIFLTAAEADRHSLPTADPEINRQRLLQEVQRACASGQICAIPVFALGPAQELYAALVLAQRAGAFPDWDVRLAGLAADISRHYRLELGVEPGPWDCDFLVAEDSPSPRSLIITSTFQTNDSPAARFAGDELDVKVLPAPTVFTHASWGEQMALAVGTPCHGVLCYHSPALSFELELAALGRRVKTLSAMTTKLV